MLELNESPELDQLAGAADLFFHEPQEARVASFDVKSPFRPTFTRLVTQPAPAGRENCRRFGQRARRARHAAHGRRRLAAFAGREDAVREFVQAYRELPPIAFRTLDGARSRWPSAPRRRSRTYLYLVNDSPWPATVRLAIDAPATTRVERRWAATVRRPPQASGRLSSSLMAGDGQLLGAGRKVRAAARRASAEAAEALDTRVKELWARAATLKHPESKDGPTNGDFELPQAADGSLSGSILSDRAGSKFVTDDQQPHHGKHACG